MTENKKIETIDAYIQTTPVELQTILQKVREIIHQAAPEATEAMSYQMPTFKLQGKNLIHFAGWKDHLAIYPTPDGIDNLQDELAPYRTGKGTLQFPLDKPIPYELITKIVKARLQ
jgi:uncharacterized protein YdhG (YjbR/CyaY superfamily)